ncbi:hypothetical protein [Zooshikella sp. RANM57]|uniref:hypothetical protein n=1 Tax=Zooshikella sp. RANM57 TaxID=3425863 RepID=UPI003D6F3403
MKQIILFFIILIISSNIYSEDFSDPKIKQLIIQRSIQAYPGNCPCPYNLARNGSRCGKRSAYSKPGGYSPYCYPSDISESVIRQFRDQLKLTQQ